MRNSLQSLLISLIIVSPISGQVVDSFNGNIVGNNSLNNNANTVAGGATRVPLPGSSGSRPLFPPPGNLPRFPSLPGSGYPQFPLLNRRFGFGGYGWAGYGGFGGYGLRRYGPKYPYGSRLKGYGGRGQAGSGGFGGAGLSGLGGFGGPALSGLSGFGGPGLEATGGFSGVNGFGGLGGAGLGGFPGPVGPPGAAGRPDRDHRRYSANIQRG